jgi:hypothetical protein
MEIRLVPLSPPPPCNAVKGIGARLKGAAVVTGFAVLAAIGFAGCKAVNGGNGLDSEDQGLDGIISFAQDGDIKFEDEKDPFELKAKLAEGVLLFTTISWNVETGADVVEISGEGEAITVTPKGNVGDAVITATLIPNEGIDLGDIELGASFSLSVIETPTVTVSKIGDVMLNSGNQPREKHISAVYTPDSLSAFEPVFEWELDTTEDKAELDALTGGDVTLKAKGVGAGKVKVKLKVLEREFDTETAFNIKDFDARQEQHQSIAIANAPSGIIATDTSAEFSVSFTPATALYETIDWVYDKNKFTLDSADKSKIKLTAKAGSAGSYTIKACSSLDTSVEDSFNITVTPVTVSVKAVAGKPDAISKGEETKYEAAVNARNKTVTWSVGNTSAAVSAEGVITNPLAVSSNTNVNVTAKSAVDSSASGTKSVTLKPPAYTLVYDKNADGATGTMANEARTFGTPYTLSANKYINSGFNFNNWHTTNTGKEGVSYTDKQANVNIEPSRNGATVTLYAQWVPLAPTTVTDNGTWTAPATGNYTIEVWGAQGAPGYHSKYNDNGAKCADGGLGGYSKGEKITLNAGDVLTLKVGVQGAGGAGVGAATKVAPNGNTAWSGASGAGGGRTEVLKGTTTLIIAGGGGGAGGGGHRKTKDSSNTFYASSAGSAGGGYNAAPGAAGSGVVSAATATAHGAGGTNLSNASYNGTAGTDAGPGKGGNGFQFSGSSGWNYTATVSGGGGGGGAGYKNGGGGSGGPSDGTIGMGASPGYCGGGGSGYAKVGSGGFASASGKAGIQSGNGKVVITYTP